MDYGNGSPVHLSISRWQANRTVSSRSARTRTAPCSLDGKSESIGLWTAKLLSTRLQGICPAFGREECFVIKMALSGSEPEMEFCTYTRAARISSPSKMGFPARTRLHFLRIEKEAYGCRPPRGLTAFIISPRRGLR